VACRNGDADLIVSLLDAGADVNLAGEMGTPRQVAEEAGQKDALKALRRTVLCMSIL
jgi:ankyrin repeat protein